MKKSIYIISVLLILSCALSSCSTADFPDRRSTDSLFICILDKYSPGFVERYKNTRNTEKLKVGMTKKEVFRIMGEPLMYEAYAKPDQWFYYTDWDWADCAKTKKECTPLVFKNGRLIGWGRVFYRRYIHRDWLYNQDVFFQKHKLVE
ncbi:MAG: DUF3192 domain-containing protein [Victivallales bacterium]|nr:DUF3192 domain-containing protein [Victivallales bacterium]MCF7888727.1 DUF3192 domain-containing protein [Victivallales bacterium]